MSQRVLNCTYQMLYNDQEIIQTQLQNYLVHEYNLTDVIDFTSRNLYLTTSQTYAATNVNFLMVSGDLDFQITIDGTKQFTLTQFVLIQRVTTFNFVIQPVSIPSSCSINIHCVHGKISMS